MLFYHRIFPTNDPMLGNYIICCSGWESRNEVQLSLSPLTNFPSPSSHASSSLLLPLDYFLNLSFSVLLVILSCTLSLCLTYYYSGPFPNPHCSWNDLFKNTHVIKLVPFTLMGLIALPKLASTSLWPHLVPLSSMSPCLGLWVSFNSLNSSSFLSTPTVPST